MKVILTGVTGNLGYEVALDLNRRGIEVIPIIRPDKHNNLNTVKIPFAEVIHNDLTDDEKLKFSKPIDCIVHCAGNIHFRTSGNSNERMTTKLVELAKRLQVPLYCVSTAYIYRPPGVSQVFNNAYEVDKFRSEQVLSSSGIRYGIFRPSVLVGNSKSGEIQNFNGYYSIVKAFYFSLNNSKHKVKKLRFPNLPGKSNLVPVDQAAYYIGNEVQSLDLKSTYITNPKPPESSWVLKETLDFFDLAKAIDLMNISFEQYVELKLTFDEKRLYEFIKHYYPYWSINYDFPTSVCEKNLIDHEYLIRTLSFLKSSNSLNYG